jgi:hypothetical protein
MIPVYNHSTPYALGDVVSYQGQYYIRIGDPGEAYEPGDTIAWAIYTMPTKQVTGAGSITGSGEIA